MARPLLAALAACCLLVPAPSSSATFAYVSAGDKTLQVIDVAARTKVATLSVPGHLAFGAAAHPGGNEVFLSVPIHHRGYIAVVETATHSFAKAIPVDSNPGQVVFNRTGSRAYVVHEHGSSEISHSTVTEIDTASREAIGTIRIESREIAIAVSPAGLLYVARTFGAGIDVIDPQTRQVLHTLSTPPGPRWMVFDAAGSRLYVSQTGALQFGSTVTVFDVGTRGPIGSIEVGFRPGRLSLSPDGSRLFVPINNAVRVVDTSSLSLQGNLPLAGNGLVVPLPTQQSLLVLDMSGHRATIADDDDFGSIESVPMNAPYLAAVAERSVTTTPAEEAQEPLIVSGLWWNPTQSGWGINLTQRRNIVFGAWFTYSINQPKWYVLPSCALSNPACPTCVSGASCTGALYETSYEGPPGTTGGFHPEGVIPRTVGTMTLTFQSPDQATMGFVIDGNAGSATISRQLFAARTPFPEVDYTDLWWNPLESGWGVSLTHQSQKAFLVWFRYSLFGKNWEVAPDCAMNDARTGCTGPMYRTSGGGNPFAFDPTRVVAEQIGQVDVTFMGPNSAVIAERPASGADARFSVVRRQLF